MFFSKKKGLRSFRSVLFLLVAIVIATLLILFIVREYFAAPPICYEYENLVQKIRSPENGFVYYIALDNLAERMFQGYFSMGWDLYLPDEMDKYIYSKKDTKVLMMNATEYLWYYKFLLNEGLIFGEFDLLPKYNSVLRAPTTPVEKTGVKGIAQKIMNFAIFPEKNWKEDFIRNSHGIMENIKKANQSSFVIPHYYLSHGRLVNVFDYKVMLMELVNILIYLEKGDYENALEWIQEFNKFIQKIGVFCIDSQITVQFLSVIDVAITYPVLQLNFYDDILCSLLETRDAIEEVDFKSVYRKSIFELEEAYVNFNMGGAGGGPLSEIQNSVKMFFAYNNTARLLEKHGKTFENSTWSDLEKAVLYNQGKLSDVIKEIRIKTAKYNLYHTHWLFSSGEIWQNVLRHRNTVLSAVYGSILKVLIEKYRAEKGCYPVSLNGIIEKYFTEEEIAWMLQYLDIHLSREKYYIDYYPLAKTNEANDKSKLMRDAYRIRSSN